MIGTAQRPSTTSRLAPTSTPSRRANARTSIVAREPNGVIIEPASAPISAARAVLIWAWERNSTLRAISAAGRLFTIFDAKAAALGAVRSFSGDSGRISASYTEDRLIMPRFSSPCTAMKSPMTKGNKSHESSFTFRTCTRPAKRPTIASRALAAKAKT